MRQKSRLLEVKYFYCLYCKRKIYEGFHCRIIYVQPFVFIVAVPNVSMWRSFVYEKKPGLLVTTMSKDRFNPVLASC